MIGVMFIVENNHPLDPIVNITWGLDLVVHINLITVVSMNVGSMVQIILFWKQKKERNGWFEGINTH